MSCGRCSRVQFVIIEEFGFLDNVGEQLVQLSSLPTPPEIVGQVEYSCLYQNKHGDPHVECMSLERDRASLRIGNYFSRSLIGCILTMDVVSVANGGVNIALERPLEAVGAMDVAELVNEVSVHPVLVGDTVNGVPNIGGDGHQEAVQDEDHKTTSSHVFEDFMMKMMISSTLQHSAVGRQYCRF